MDTDDAICYLTATELAAAYRAREISPVDVVEALLARIDTYEPAINAFVTILPDQAREAAQAAERSLLSGAPESLRPLHGLPILVKDLTPTAGVRTTFGSPRFRDNVPDRDSLAWGRMKGAGAILLGKTTTPDFGELGVTDSTLTGITNNPWDISRTAGGSSGGSAAGVVAGFGPLSWGSDGGGSIRIPAACCGAVGLKASIGRIPGYGEQHTFESVTTCGPITRSVADAALLLSVTAGPDVRDPIALPASGVDYLAEAIPGSLDGVRIAYSPDLGQARVSADVRHAVDAAAQTLVGLGAAVEEISLQLPDALDYFVAWWGREYIAICEEPGEGELPWAVQQIAALARQSTSKDRWRAATETRALIAQEFARVFADFDVLITPTMPLTAFVHPGDLAGASHVDGFEVPLPFLYFHRMTEPFSHAGLPAISVPCGFDPQGLPVGLQIVAPYHDDATVLRVASAYEAATSWHESRPF